MTARQVLVVDDEIGIRELLRDILQDEGYQVMLAENAAEAREYRQHTRPAIANGLSLSAIIKISRPNSLDWLSSVIIFSPGLARRTIISSCAKRSKSKACNGWPSSNKT